MMKSSSSLLYGEIATMSQINGICAPHRGSCPALTQCRDDDDDDDDDLHR